MSLARALITVCVSDQNGNFKSSMIRQVTLGIKLLNYCTVSQSKEEMA